jgi:hypothetical protein
VDSLCVGMGIARRADATFTILRIYYGRMVFLHVRVCWGRSRKTRSAGAALRPLHHRGAHNVHGNISMRIAEFVSEIIALIAFN